MNLAGAGYVDPDSPELSMNIQVLLFSKCGAGKTERSGPLSLIRYSAATLQPLDKLISKVSPDIKSDFCNLVYE